MEFGVRDEHSLAVRRPPMLGESLKSFLLRLANVNACKYKTLVKHLGFGPSTWFTPGSASESMMYTALSKVLNVSEQALLEILRTPSMKDLWIPSVIGTSEMKVRTVRACLSCLSEAPYHRQAWQHAMYCVCTKHNEQMIDCCPHCGNGLELDFCLNGRCHDCGSHMSDGPVQVMTVPVWQKEVFQGAQSRELLQSLLGMSMVAVRPLDLFTSDIRVRDMRVVEVMALMQKAWNLLNSYTARQTLKEALNRRWHEVNQVMGEELPLTLYREATALALANDNASDGELDAPVFESDSREFDIIKSTKRFAFLCEGASTRGLVKATQLMNFLGIKPKDFEQLRQAGVFIQINPKAAKKDALYCLEAVARQFSKLIRVDNVEEGYVAYDEFVPVACKFISGLHEGRVLVDIFNCDFPTQLLSNQKGTVIGRLYVHKEAFCEKYTECDIYEYQTVPVTFLPGFFGTQMPNVRAALKSVFVQKVMGFDVLRAKEDIPTSALKELHDNYLILNKWAYSHSKSKTKCLCALKRAKVDPLVRVNEEHCNSFEIYPKSAEQVLLDRYDELAQNYKGRKRRLKSEF
ncbi:TniQ family protein [Photobacterium sanguinicancri]|uniref:TniQ family protein n=1 Tax=Photobacterium sanguinicancri TaxID=875932 RepID=UPI0021C36CA7|nr:TniQ family protein [Photobacterium sanguinicancri]